MKYVINNKGLTILIFLALFFSSVNNTVSQIISTIAGRHDTMAYFGDGGPATDAIFYMTTWLTLDSVNDIYIADDVCYTVREVNSNGIINTVAGNYAFLGDSGDGGPATAAYIDPAAVSWHHNNYYISNVILNTIRMVDKSGIINGIIGIPIPYPGGHSGDGGPATNAELSIPCGTAMDDSGNFYIAESLGDIVRKVNSSGIISTFAGNYYYPGGYSGDGGPATAAELAGPNDVAVDANGNVYFSDGSFVIRKVNTNGIISTYAGNGYGWQKNLHSCYSGDGGPATAAELCEPAGISFDTYGNLFIADLANNVIRMVNTNGIISTVAGNYYYGYGYSGDGGPATAAELAEPANAQVDIYGNLIINDCANNVIRKVSDIYTSIRETESITCQLQLFPNPNRGKFLLVRTGTTACQKAFLEVYDINGRHFKTQGFTSQAINVDISDKPNGIYLYRVVNTTGELLGEGKFIVAK
jgi:trimeric autotransporter adhesin